MKSGAKTSFRSATVDGKGWPEELELPSSAFFSGHSQGAGLKSEQLQHKRAPMGDAKAAGSPYRNILKLHVYIQAKSWSTKTC